MAAPIGYPLSKVEDSELSTIPLGSNATSPALSPARSPPPTSDSDDVFASKNNGDKRYNADDYDFDHYNTPPVERWQPLSGSGESEEEQGGGRLELDTEKMRELEEEQEQMNNSLMALTSHFAQVQLRLKQICEAPAEDKESLLKELEGFANQGVPDLSSYEETLNVTQDTSTEEHENIICKQKEKQQQLMEKLRQQLQELETYAYQSGDTSDLPSAVSLEKHRMLVDELKEKLSLNVDTNKMDAEQIIREVNQAISQITNPARAKEQLVEQLKTQIIDLERFVTFLQAEGSSPVVKGPAGVCTCGGQTKQGKLAAGTNRSACPLHTAHASPANKPAAAAAIRTSDSKQRHYFDASTFQSKTQIIMKRLTGIIHMIAVSQVVCGNREPFRKNTLKTTSRGNHWGDLRAKVELAVDKVLELVSRQGQDQRNDSDYTSDSDDDAPRYHCDEELMLAVRKDLGMALLHLMQHGLMELSTNRSLMPLQCLPLRTSSNEPVLMHPWHFILKYYEAKGGYEYNESPHRKLSESFNLEDIGGTPITTKQTLLGGIGHVLETHGPLKRSDDAQFKAFICHALNERKLVMWLRLVMKCRELIRQYYQPWSYVYKTGMDDTIQSLDRFTKYKFDIPIDISVKHFQSIKDAF